MKAGTLSRLDKIVKSIRIVKNIDSDYKYEIESMLYAFADRFLDGKELEKVKEELSMTKLGEMLVEDGIKKGREEGIRKKALDTAIKAIEMGMSNDVISKLTGLTENEVEVLRIAKSN